MLLLFKQGITLQLTAVPDGIIPPHHGGDPLHIGFAVTHGASTLWLERLRGAGIKIESEVNSASGGRSRYFRDPVNPRLELVTPGTRPNH